MTDTTAAPAEGTAPVSANPAPAAAAPAAAAESATPAAPASASPASASAPAGVALKMTLLQRLAGAADVVGDVEGRLKAEQDAHQVTKNTLASVQSELETVKGQLKSYQDLESKLEKALVAQGAAEKAAETAKSETATAISKGVTDVVASLGVSPENLPAAQEQPAGAAAAAGEFGHLKGRDRAAAAFTSQLAALSK